MNRNFPGGTACDPVSDLASSEERWFRVHLCPEVPQDPLVPGAGTIAQGNVPMLFVKCMVFLND